MKGALYMMRLNYKQNGDYLIPEMGLTEQEQKPLGKYGMMRRKYLEENRSGLYTRMILNGTLMEHLQEIESTAQTRLETIMESLKKQNGVTEDLKATNQMAWVARMNSLKNQAEEMIFSELIFA
jgi:hypothetical protein